MRRSFKVVYYFTSQSAYADVYTRERIITAKSLSEAETAARLEGPREFGARFNDNCFDWQVSEIPAITVKTA